jgi:OPT family oligopeptide transporter
VNDDVVASSPRREATARALVTGAVLGVVLAAANVYTSIKVGVIDGGSMTAALLAFAIFSIGRRRTDAPFGALESNITQTAASSAAVMSFVTGVAGPIPALAMMGTHVSSAAVVVFGVGVGGLGVLVAALLRRRLVMEEALPFPTGAATGEVIEATFGARHVAVRRVRLLLGGATLAGVVTWCRDGRPAIVPQGFMLPGAIGGVAAAVLGIGVSASPLMLATGAMVGLRNTLGMLLGAATARIVLAPWLLRAGVVPDAELGSLASWLIWPSLGLLVSGSFLPLLLDGGAIVRSFRQLASLGSAWSVNAAAADARRAARPWMPLLLAASAVAIVVACGALAFGVEPLVMLAALVLALVLANVAARTTGETDFGPAGSFGTVGTIAFSGKGAATGGTTGLMAGGTLSMGVATQTSQTLWAFRAGRQLGASPGAQIRAQLLGVLVGAAVTVPVYLVIVSSYGLGNERMPATSALSCKATVEAMRGWAALPPWGATAAAIGLSAGAILTLLARGRAGRLLPSAASIGVGFILPFPLVAASVAGAVLAVAARKLFGGRGFDQPSLLAVASGGMAGESIVGVVIAILIATGLLG